MLARLLQNWPYKLAAVAIAVALRFYVVAQQNQHTSMTVPVGVLGLPPNLTLDSSCGNVQVDISGPSTDVDTLRRSDIVADVDLSNQRAGRTAPLPIIVSLSNDIPPDKRDEIQVQIDANSPTRIAVNLTPLVTVRKIVRVQLNQPAPLGYMFGAPTIAPSIVEIQARQDLVNATAVVTADVAVPDDFPGATPLPITGDFYVTPRDRDGKALDGITLNPSTVHVTIPVIKASSTKVVPVVTSLIGTPAASSRVVDAMPSPSVMTLSGSPDALAKTSVVMTRPVDVTGKSSDVVVQSTVLVPASLTAVGSVSVKVHVRIVKVAGAQPAAPAPASAPAKTQ